MKEAGHTSPSLTGRKRQSALPVTGRAWRKPGPCPLTELGGLPDWSFLQAGGRSTCGCGWALVALRAYSSAEHTQDRWLSFCGAAAETVASRKEVQGHHAGPRAPCFQGQLCQLRRTALGRWRNLELSGARCLQEPTDGFRKVWDPKPWTTFCTCVVRGSVNEQQTFWDTVQAKGSATRSHRAGRSCHPIPL